MVFVTVLWQIVSTLSRMFPGVGNAKSLALGKDSIKCYVN